MAVLDYLVRDMSLDDDQISGLLRQARDAADREMDGTEAGHADN
jgi:hypothetical protein